MTSPTVFTQIINKDLPGHFLWRDELCVGFLSINPVRPGHSLVIPVREVDHWLDLSDEEIQHLNLVAKYIGEALDELFKPDRIGLMIAGFEVPHAHLHVMCIDNMADLDLIHAVKEPDHTELAKTAEQIRGVLTAKGYEAVADS